jgi:hypothetical protein
LAQSLAPIVALIVLIIVAVVVVVVVRRRRDDNAGQISPTVTASPHTSSYDSIDVVSNHMQSARCDDTSTFTLPGIDFLVVIRLLNLYCSIATRPQYVDLSRKSNALATRLLFFFFFFFFEVK